MTHAVTSGRVIDEGGSGQAYKWFYVAGHASKGPEQQRINAENYGESDRKGVCVASH